MQSSAITESPMMYPDTAIDVPVVSSSSTIRKGASPPPSTAAIW